MNVLDLALELYAEIKHIGIEADDLEVGGDEVVTIPHAEQLSALLVKGKGGKRFRITGIEVTREK